MVFTKSGKISQKTLRAHLDLDLELLRKSQQLSALKKEIKVLKTKKESFDSVLLKAIKDSKGVSFGQLKLMIIKEEKIPRLSWKTLFIEYVGQTLADDLMNSRVPKFINVIKIVKR